MMKNRVALTILALALCGCGKGSAVLVEVSSSIATPLDHFHVNASIGAATRMFDVPLKSSSIATSQSFVIDVGEKYSGKITVVLDAIAKSGVTAASATNSAQLERGKTVTLSIVLDDGLGDGGIGDGAVPDGADLSSHDAAQPCGTQTSACNASTLTSMCSTSGASTTEDCPTGCLGASDAGAARCAQIVPTTPIASSDVYPTDVTATTTLTGTVVFDTATGAITSGTTTVRAANAMPYGTRAVDATSGIAFRIATIDNDRSMAIWGFQSLTVGTGANVYFAGANAVGLTVTGDVNIALNGAMNLQAYDRLQNPSVCPNEVAEYSPGGEAGNNGSNNPEFPGQGGLGNSNETYNASQQLLGVYHGGGGGGGFGGTGGQGGFTSNTNPGSAGGIAYGVSTLSPIIGGAAGGWSVTEGEANGGAGGGALQIVAGRSISISGVINGGGCGGRHSGDNTGPTGGGAGGAILLETPTLTATASAVLAVNGGGGAAGGCAADGQPGQPSGDTAAGGPCASTNGAAGGAGGANGSPNGVAGTQVQVGMIYYGSGGGGGVGRMRFNVSNSPTLSTATISPAPGSTYTTQGVLATQ